MDDSLPTGTDRNEAAAHNHWRRVTRTVAYDNKWITVYHDDVVRPDGMSGVYGVVHLKHRSVGVVAIDDRNRVLLVGQYRYATNRYSWEIPAGGCPPEEDPIETARRELREETGYTAKNIRLLIHAHMSDSISDEEGFCFLAETLIAGHSAPEETEHLLVRWEPFDDVMQRIATGEITDALTIIALQKTALERLTICIGESN